MHVYSHTADVQGGSPASARPASAGRVPSHADGPPGSAIAPGLGMWEDDPELEAKINNISRLQVCGRINNLNRLQVTAIWGVGVAGRRGGLEVAESSI